VESILNSLMNNFKETTVAYLSKIKK
ncbi:CopY family transcriptional regulator, partial [Thermococci archaeon]